MKEKTEGAACSLTPLNPANMFFVNKTQKKKRFLLITENHNKNYLKKKNGYITFWKRAILV